MRKQFFCLSISIVTLFFLSACGGYRGPGLGKVMTQLCQSNTKFEDFYNCVNANWYQPVHVAGFGGNSQVNYAMSVGNNLLNGVRAGQLTDADAIFKWQSTQLSLHQAEQAQQARQAAALQNLGNTLQNYGNATNSSNSGAYTGQSSATAFLTGERTQGFSKICIYNRLGSVESLTIGSTELCPLTK